MTSDLYPGEPKVVKITLDRSTDTDLQLTFQSDDVTLLDITGFSFEMKVVDEWGKTSQSIMTPPIDADIPTSTVTIHFLASTLADIAAGEYKYKFIGTRSGKPRTYLKGAFVLED